MDQQLKREFLSRLRTLDQIQASGGRRGKPRKPRASNVAYKPKQPMSAQFYAKEAAMAQPGKPIYKKDLAGMTKNELKDLVVIGDKMLGGLLVGGAAGGVMVGGGGTKKGAAHNPWLQFLKQYRAAHPELTGKYLTMAASQEYRSLAM